MSEPTFRDMPVEGGALRVADVGDGPMVLGIHGLTASSISMQPTARGWPERRTFVAPDLRGRGGSAGLPGPYGMEAHARDCAALIEDFGGEPAVVVGHSMGGYVAVVLAATATRARRAGRAHRRRPAAADARRHARSTSTR